MRTIFDSKIGRWIPIIAIEVFLGFIAALWPAYAFIILGIGIFALLAFIWPELSYYAFVLMLGNHVISIMVYLYYLPDFLSCVLVLAMIPFWAFARMANIRPESPGSPLTLQMGFLLAWSLVSLLWVSQINYAIVSLATLLFCYLMFYFSVTMIRTKKIFNTVVWLIILLGVVNSILVFRSVYNPSGEKVYEELFKYGETLVWLHFDYIPGGKGSGLSHPQGTGFFLNIAIMLAIGTFLAAQDTKKKIGILLIILFMVGGHLATVSKSAFLGLIGGLTFFIYNIRALRRRFILSMTLMLVFLVLIFMLIKINDLTKTLTEGVVGTVAGDTGYSSIEGRVAIWKKGFGQVFSTYGLGAGMGNFYYMYDASTRWHAHSMFFSVIFALGFVGLGIWAWFWIKAFLSARSAYKENPDTYCGYMLLSVMAMWVSILIFGLFEMYYEYPTMWTVLGISMALVNIANQKSPASEGVDLAGSGVVSKKLMWRLCES